MAITGSEIFIPCKDKSTGLKIDVQLYGLVVVSLNLGENLSCEPGTPSTQQPDIYMTANVGFPVDRGSENPRASGAELGGAAKRCLEPPASLTGVGQAWNLVAGPAGCGDTCTAPACLTSSAKSSRSASEVSKRAISGCFNKAVYLQ